MSRKIIADIQSFRLPEQDWRLTSEQQAHLKQIAAQCGGKDESILCLCHICAPKAVQAFKSASAPPIQLWTTKAKVLQHFEKQCQQSPELAAEAEAARSNYRGDGWRWLSHKTYLQLVCMAIVRGAVPAMPQVQAHSIQAFRATPLGALTSHGFKEASPVAESSETDREWSGLGTVERKRKRAQDPDSKRKGGKQRNKNQGTEKTPKQKGGRPKKKDTQQPGTPGLSRSNPWTMAPARSIRQQWLDAFQSSGLSNRSEKTALAACYEREGIAFNTLLELENPIDDAMAITAHIIGDSFALKSLMKKFLKDLVDQQGSKPVAAKKQGQAPGTATAGKERKKKPGKKPAPKATDMAQVWSKVRPLPPLTAEARCSSTPSGELNMERHVGTLYMNAARKA